ncbi:MAG: SemiSWEET family transporter [Candidatus Nanopelagicales bacterium]
MSALLAVITTSWGLVMALAPLLQLRIVIRDRDAGGVSLAWVSILFVGFVLWFSYGLVNRDVPLILTNAVSITATAALLIAIRVYTQPQVPQRV